MNVILKRALLPFVLSATLIGCGGSSTTDSTHDAETNQGKDSAVNSRSNGKAVTSFGQIDGFGSVIVNGVHYETDNAVITVNGKVVEQADLKVGYMVKVTGQVFEDGSAEATKVEYTADVVGPVSEVDMENKTVTVLGQTVTLSDETYFDDIDEKKLASVLENAIVEVSGYLDENGLLVAAHIELEADAEEFQIHGEISDVDLENSTFTINGQLIHFGEFGQRLNDRESLEVGISVVVTGSLDGEVFVINDEIAEEDFADDIEQGFDIGMAGFVSDFDGENRFKINGILVEINSETIFEYGGADDLKNGTLIELVGLVIEDFVILAEEIQFQREHEIEFEGFVDSIDTEANTLSLFGLTFTINEDTSFNDESDTDVHEFSLSDVRAGDFVVIDAFMHDGETNTLIASRVVREEIENDFEFSAIVMGRVSALEGDSLSLNNGITVILDENTHAVLEGVEALTSVVVEVEGYFEGSLLYASALEIVGACEVPGSNEEGVDKEINFENEVCFFDLDDDDFGYEDDEECEKRSGDDQESECGDWPGDWGPGDWECEEGNENGMLCEDDDDFCEINEYGVLFDCDDEHGDSDGQGECDLESEMVELICKGESDDIELDQYAWCEIDIESLCEDNEEHEQDDSDEDSEESPEEDSDDGGEEHSDEDIDEISNE